MSETNEPRRWVGGGAIASIVGLSPWSSPYQAWLEITGRAPALDAETAKFFARRKRLERFIVENLEEEHGLVVRHRNQRYTDPAVPHFRAELDVEFEPREEEPADRAELKSVHPMAARGWGRAEDGDAAVPLYVIAQVQWGFGVKAGPAALAVPQIGFDDGRLLRLQPDAEAIGLLRERAAYFWAEYVVKDQAPPLSSIEDLKLAYPTSTAKRLQASAALVEDVRRVANARALIRATEKDLEAYELRVKLAMGDAGELVDADGTLVCTWRQNADSDMVDADRLKRERPDIYADYLKARRGARPLLTKIK